MNIETGTSIEDTFLPAPRTLSDEELDSVSAGFTVVVVVVPAAPAVATGAVTVATAVVATGAAIIGAAAGVLAAINKIEKAEGPKDSK